MGAEQKRKTAGAPAADKADAFKICTLCGRVWRSRAEFLQDPTVTLCGYQADFEVLVAGVFLFNHTVCGTTFSVDVEPFRDLNDAPVFLERKTGTDACPGHCLRSDDLDPCPAHCECAWVRNVIQKIRRNGD